MNLTDLFQYGNKNSSNSIGQGNKTETIIVSSGQYLRMVKNLAPGQTLHGEIVGKNGNELHIRIDKDIVITAKLEKDLNLSVGQNMTFEVKNNSGSQIALRPLFENMATDINILKALDAANLPATNDFVKMVSSMMEAGMSIDKASLTDMGKLIMTNSGTPPETIVMMRNFNLPITPENIQQFENYQNYEHQLLNNVTDILSEFPQMFKAMLQDGQMDAAVNLYTKILQLFSADTGEMPQLIPSFGQTTQNPQQGNETAPAGNPFGVLSPGQLPTEAVIQESVIQEAVIKESVIPESIIQQSNSTASQTQTANPEAVQAAISNINSLIMEDTLLSFLDEKNILKSENNVLGRETSVLAETLNEGQRASFSRLLTPLGFSEEQLAQIKNGDIPIKQLLQDISKLLAENGNIDKADIIKLFGSKEYNKTLNNEILKQWLLKPSDVAQKSNVEDFYGRLREQTTRLTEALSMAAKDTPLNKSVTVMQNNIDFMNQMNQLYHYVQLPLKMSGGNANGDLYVYKNKKSSGQDGESLSALLHLDMKHLGPVDIYVTMKDKNVGTQFYLKDEEMLDFITQNIHILDERLTSKGYLFQSKIQVTEEEHKNVIENMTSEERKDKVIAQYAFDVRA